VFLVIILPGEMKPVVQIVAQAEYQTEEIRSRVREVLAAEEARIRGKTVFVKPSFVYPARPPLNRGINTQPEFVGGVVRALADLGATKIWVGEDCLVGPSESGFLAMGVLPYLRGYAEPVYLQDEPRVEVGISEALIEDRFLLPKKLMEADFFVSLPKLKVNMYALVTLSVKNHIGLLLARDRLTNHHYNIHKKIADLYRARLPDFVIADAILAGQGQGPMHAEPAALKVMVAGSNGVAVDAVSCNLMGYDPKEIPHLVYLAEKGLGPLGLDEIDLRGAELLEQRRTKLIRPQSSLTGFPSSIKFLVGQELACPEGCVGMIRGSLDRWFLSGNWKALAGYAFIVGKTISTIPAGLTPEKTIVVGDCAATHQGLGTFIPGCPIPPMAITYALTRKGVFGPLNARLRALPWSRLAHALRLKVR